MDRYTSEYTGCFDESGWKFKGFKIKNKKLRSRFCFLVVSIRRLGKFVCVRDVRQLKLYYGAH